jgi:putative ABC transport system permease protein
VATPRVELGRWWRVARLRLRSLVLGRRADAEIDEELAFHLAMAAEDAEARGASRIDARLEARRRLDGMALRRDQMRDARGLAWLDALRQDVRHAWRGLRRTPIATAAAIASLGLGLGATASLFAVVDAVLLRELPLPDASRVVWIDELRNGTPSSGTPQRLADWARLDAIAAAG